MKRIFIGIMVGLFVSALIFVWGWKGMEKTYLIPKQTADKKYCNQLEICQKCNRKYECLKNECDKNSAIKDSCQEIIENWKNFQLELTPEDFVSSLCGKNDDYYKINCLKEQSRNLKLELDLALNQIDSNLKISHSLLLFRMYNSFKISAIIILSIPPFLGFFIGWVIYIFHKRIAESK